MKKTIPFLSGIGLIFLIGCGDDGVAPPRENPPLENIHSTERPFFGKENVTLIQNTFFMWSPALPDFGQRNARELTEAVHSLGEDLLLLKAEHKALLEKKKSHSFPQEIDLQIAENKEKTITTFEEQKTKIGTLADFGEWFDAQPERITFRFPKTDQIEASIEGWSAQEGLEPALCSTGNGLISQIRYHPQGGIFQFNVTPMGSAAFEFLIYRKPVASKSGLVRFHGDLKRLEKDGSVTYGIALMTGRIDTTNIDASRKK